MIGSPNIIVFIIFYFSVQLFYFIIIATSHIRGILTNSYIFVGRDSRTKCYYGISINTHTCVCLEVNTHTGTLDYFINDRHLKDRVVNVPKDVYFGVWYFICYLFFLIWKYYNLKQLAIVIILIIIFIFFRFVDILFFIVIKYYLSQKSYHPSSQSTSPRATTRKGRFQSGQPSTFSPKNLMDHLPSPPVQEQQQEERLWFQQKLLEVD
jgi:hypothetical protein